MNAKMNDRVKVLVAVACGAALLLSIWLIPGNVAESQNREQRAFPDLTSSNLADTATWATVDAALRDELGAQVAVAEAAGVVSAELLHLSPNSTTIVTSSGEPFFATDFINPCRTNAARLDLLQTQLKASVDNATSRGVYALYAIAPDKSTIRRDKLGIEEGSLLRCADPVRETVQEWAADGDLPILTFWNALADADNASDEGAYYRGDTHWTAVGAKVFTTGVLERLVEDGEAPPGVLDSLEEYSDEPGESKVPDLYHNMALTTEEDRPEIVFNRLGVDTERTVVTNSAGTALTQYASTTTEAPLVEGRTLILGDSFLRSHATTQLAPFFENVTFGSLRDSADFDQYDRIILERVQRNTAESGWPTLSEVE